MLFNGVKVNGCSLFPEGKYTDCCNIHDFNYATCSGKTKSDIILYRCVRNNGYPKLAVLMFLGVTIFGWPFYWRCMYKRWKKNKSN